MYILGSFDNIDTVEVWNEKNGGRILDKKLAKGDYDFSAVAI